MGLFKVGPHCVRPLAESLAWAAVAPIVKSLDSIEPFLIARQDAIRVFRHYMAAQPFGRNGVDVANEVLSALGGYRHPSLYVELYNEAAMDFTELTRAVQICHAAGVKVAAFAFTNAEGNYNDAWFAISRAHLWGGVDAIPLHAYWGKTGPELYHAYRLDLCGHKDTDPPVIFTEIGLETIDGTTKDDLFALTCSALNLGFIEQFDAHYAGNPKVIGSTVFAVNTYDDFKQYDVAPIVDKLIAKTAVKPEGGQTTMDQIREWLKDMWARAGVTSVDGDAVFDWSVKQAKLNNKVFVPQDARGGSYQNWSDPRYVLCYTLPAPLYFERGVFEIKEGFPPLA